MIGAAAVFAAAVVATTPAVDELEAIRIGIERHEASYTARALDALTAWQRELIERTASDVTIVAVTPRAGSPTGGIQEAIDSLPAAGGVVSLEEGTYRIRVPVRLRGNLALVGAPGAVLVRTPFTSVPLLDDAAAGSRAIVAPPGAFPAGAAIAVRDVQTFGWNTTRARVMRADGETLHLDQPLAKPYAVERGAFVTDAAPAIEAVGVANVVVRGITIDGRTDRTRFVPPGGVSDFTDAAIHFYNVRNAVVENVTIRRYPGEALSLQGGANVIARNNTIEECASHGIHIGTGIVDSIVTDNRSVRNGDDGVYFCASVRNVLVQRNVVFENDGNGIGGLGDVNDRGNIVYGNTIARNGRNGIAVHESGNLVFRNTLRDNGRRGAEFADVKLEPSALANVILDNRIDASVASAAD